MKSFFSSLSLFLFISTTSITARSVPLCNEIFQPTNKFHLNQFVTKGADSVSFRDIEFKKPQYLHFKKKLTRSTEIRFPGDSFYTILHIYGNPVKVGIDYFLDFKIDSTKNEELAALGKGPFRINLKKLAQLDNTFFSKDNVYILPSITSRSRTTNWLKPYILIDFNSKETFVKDIQSGEIISVPKNELYLWNFEFRRTIQSHLLQSLIKHGGQAKILKVYNHDQYYIQIQKMPSYSVELFFDLDSYFAVQKVFNKGIKILLTDSHSMIAGLVPEKNNISLSYAQLSGSPHGQMLIFTRYADRTIIGHEMIHFEDGINDSLNQNSYKNLLYNISKSLSGVENVYEIDFQRFYTMISEQRAYAAQEKMYIPYLTSTDYVPQRNPYLDLKITYKDYSKNMIAENMDLFRTLYAEPTNNFLNRIKNQNVNVYLELKEIIKKYFVENKNYSPEVLFPTHFEGHKP